MDGRVTSAAAADGNRHPDATQAAAEARQGAFGRRLVAQAPGGQQGVPARERLGTGGTPPGPEERIGSRSTTAVASSSSVAGPGPVEQTVSRLGAERPVGLNSGVDPAWNSRPCEPPWLNPDRYAELQAKHSRLIGLCERSQDVRVKEALFMAAMLVKSSEDDVGMAHELLESTRTQMLSDDDRRKLSTLLRGNKLEMPLRQSLLGRSLGLLAGIGPLGPADAALAEDLQRRLDDVCDYLRSCGPAWRGSARRIEATLPIGTGKRVAVDCHVLAGRALGPHLAGGYPAQDSGSEPCGVRYFRAPDLALSGLSNPKGQLLYAGLSHGFFHAHELSGERVAGLSDDALKSVLFEYRRRLVGRLYASNPVPASMLRPALEIIEGQPQGECERIRRLSRDETGVVGAFIETCSGRKCIHGHDDGRPLFR